MTILAPFGAPTFAQSAFTTFLLDATTDMLAFSFIAQSTTAIAKIQVHIDTETGTPGTMGVVLCANNNNVPTVSGGVPTDIGGGSPTLKSVVAADIAVGVNTITFTNAFTPTEGVKYWVVLYVISGTWDASNRYRFSVGTINFLGAGAEARATSTDTGSTWTLVEGVMQFCSFLDAGDAYLPTVNSACVSSTVENILYNDAANPDEYSSIITVPSNVTLALYGVARFLDVSSTTTSDHTVHAFTDPLGTPVQLESISIDISAYRPSLVQATVVDRFLNGPYTLTGGTVLAVSVKASSTGTVAVAQLIFPSQAARESALLLRDIHGATRNGGSGAFTNHVDRVYSFLPWLSIEAGGGGGLARIIGG